MSPRASLNMGKTFQENEEISGYNLRSEDLTVNYIETKKSNDKKDQLIQDSKEVSNTTHRNKNKNTHSILKKNTKEQSHTCKIRSRNISGYQL